MDCVDVVPDNIKLLEGWVNSELIHRQLTQAVLGKTQYLYISPQVLWYGCQAQPITASGFEPEIYQDGAIMAADRRDVETEETAEAEPMTRDVTQAPCCHYITSDHTRYQ